MEKILTLKSCPPNPTFDYADSIEIPVGVTEIVSRGGGSTIDVGKWVAKKYGLPHTAIPTTAGTGSEVTKYCVLTVDGKKTTFTDEAFIPTTYVLDPVLLRTLSDEQLVSSALDALSQALEASWSKNRTQESVSYSLMAINLITENLKLARKNPFIDAYRMNLLIAANFSGRAINITKTNVCHAISYPLTDWYGIPHGMACAMSLQYFSMKAAEIDLTEFFKDITLPTVAIDKEKIADEVMKSDKLNDFPVEVTREDILKSL